MKEKDSVILMESTSSGVINEDDVICCYCGLFLANADQLSCHVTQKHGGDSSPNFLASNNPVDDRCSLSSSTSTSSLTSSASPSSSKTRSLEQLPALNQPVSSSSAEFNRNANGNRQTPEPANSIIGHLLTTDSISNHDGSINHEDSEISSSPKKHTQLNNHDQQLFCEQCGKTFVSKYGLKSHVTRHENETLPYKCSLCSLTFNESVLLDRHVERHKAELTKNTCQQCNKVFLNRKEWAAHSQQHYYKRFPFGCNICRSNFSQLSEVKRHLGTSACFKKQKIPQKSSH